MKIAIQIPIKGTPSERIPGKNFKEIAGKPCYRWLMDKIVGKLPDGWDIYVDSESDDVLNTLKSCYGCDIKTHKRHEWYASDQANGNHLLNQFAVNHPDYDIYAQIFITALTLSKETIENVISQLVDFRGFCDSVFTVTKETGFVWYDDKAVNYDPTKMNGLKRSQDIQYFKETTGLYVITKDALLKTGCRIGEKPHLWCLNDETEAFDLDTMEDFREAEKLLNEKDS